MASKKKVEVPGHLYDNGLPFTSGVHARSGKDRLKYNLDQLEERRANKKPTLIVVDGMSGEGKTTMCVHLLDEIQGKKVEFPEHIFMGGQAFMKGLRLCFLNKRIVALYTEAGDFSKKATLTRLVRTLDRVFETFRTFNIIVIIDLPYMPKLDTGIFEKGIPRMLVHCYGRKNTGKFSVYDAERMLWLRARASDKRVVNKQKIYELVQPNFRGHFKDLEPDRSKLLDRYSTAGKSDILEIAEITGENLMNYADLAGQLNRTHEWVRRQVSRLGLKPAKVWKGKNYFTEDALNALKRIKGAKRK